MPKRVPVHLNSIYQLKITLKAQQTADLASCRG